MRSMLLASAAALALLAASPALAADDHHDHGNSGGQHGQTRGGGASGGRHDQGTGTQGGHGGGGTGVTNNTTGGGTATTGGTHTRTHAGRGHNSAFDATAGGTTTTGGSTSHHGHTNTGTNNTPPAMTQGSGGRHFRNANGNAIFGIGGHGFQAAPGRHVDHNSAAILQLRANRSASQHFHAGSYRAPHGYAYRRWSYGDVLPALYFTSDYWLSDYNDYGLPYAPPGTLWVRYGDDALLIDRYTGEIITVEYGLFD